MDIQVLLIAFAVAAPVFILGVLIRKSFEKLEEFIKANPFTAALVAAVFVAIVLAVFWAQNPELVECWPSEKFKCLLPH